LSLWYQNKATAKTTEINVAARVMSQSQRADGLNVQRTIVKTTATRSAVLPTPSVLLLIASNVSNLRSPSVNNSVSHAFILRAAGTLNTGKVLCSLRSCIRIATFCRRFTANSSPFATVDCVNGYIAIEGLESRDAKAAKARAERLTPEQKFEIAREATKARWAKKPGRIFVGHVTRNQSGKWTSR
jgi:hypothetical protein